MRLEHLLHVLSSEELAVSISREGKAPVCGYSTEKRWCGAPEAGKYFLYPDGFIAVKPASLMKRQRTREVVQTLKEKALRLGLQPRVCRCPEVGEPVCHLCGLLTSECTCRLLHGG